MALTTVTGSLAPTAVAAPPWLPPDAPLQMPPQDLWRRPGGAASQPLGEADLWQIGALVFTAVFALFGGVTAYTVLQVGGLSALELIDLLLFQILFAWIAYALAGALVGFGVSLGGRAQAADPDPHAPLSAPTGRTAILMPVHNEDPRGVFGRLQRIDASLRALGVETQFDLFLLSDTRDPDVKQAEMIVFERLRRNSGQHHRLFYRARLENRGRKAGNIADWVRRFGGAYDYMVVLDADSVMAGDTLVRLASFMDRHPRTGLLQTVPRLVNRLSVFGRIQQFASSLYGPMLSEGLAHTSGTAGNYWGHNAIIRVRAFADHAGLPVLAGPRPLGGEVLSHDFVEAALMRRAGWEVRLAPQLGGSYEECPPTLPDLIVRERRWCQGNLQHLPLVAARGLHWMSRLHLAQGVLTYLMPPLWLAFLLIGAAVSLETSLSAPGSDDYSLDMLKWLMAISLVSLFIPRALAVVRALTLGGERRAWGDPWKLVAGVVCETAVSALMAPVLMTAQTKALFDIVLGRDAGWPVQQRSDGSIGWRTAARHYLPHTVIGVALGGGALAISPAAALWMTPVSLGLVLSIPMVILTADPELGLRLKRAGLFVTPEERAPPAVLAGLASPEPYIRKTLDWSEVLDRLLQTAPEPAEAKADV